MTDWREELVEKMADGMFASDENGALRVDVMARAALAVAEPVIREQAGNALREENARLRAALEPIVKIKAFTCIYEWVPVEALRDDEEVKVKLTGAQIKKMREAAIREGGKNDAD